MEITQWITVIKISPQWITAIATILAVFVALFGPSFMSWWNRPKIYFKFGNISPYVVQSYGRSQVTSYFRVKVKNTGRTTAKNCHIKIISVVPENNSPSIPYQPDKLKWSNAPRDSRYREDAHGVKASELIPIYRENKDIVPRGGWEFCDILQAKGGLLTFISQRGDEVSRDAISHIVTMEIFGDNFKPRRVKFRVANDSKSWYQAKVEGIGIPRMGVFGLTRYLSNRLFKLL